ncbi:MAG: DNA-processing protein DprA [Candidatus Omnitrophota bacterium]|nr:DNA-processing protein DprA [Candidatus Omnitrophota bacterium]
MQDREIQTLTPKSAGYPRLLGKIHGPPEVLYVKGTLLEEDEAAVAIVGTRGATPYGLAIAGQLAEELARCGVTVVSGLAEGIDAAAHEGALKAGGRTIAVVGHGLSRIYPSQHQKLAERIAESGCIVSEFQMEEKPNPWNFPKRNRIIAGLSLGTVVVEAPFKSGALITARFAMEQGREVFAVPGPVSSRQSEGTHALLKDGAKLVGRVEDILEELAPHLKDCLNRYQALKPQPVAGAGLSGEEAQVFQAVPVGSGMGFEGIARATALQPARLLSVLTGLELKGLVRQAPGRGFSRAN